MAGLLSGAIAGAIGGAGKAMQFNAQGQIEEKRKKALLTLEQDMAMERQDDQQQFTGQENDKTRTFQREERIGGQDFTAGQNQLTRAQERELALLRERGANSRAAMSRDDWQMMTSSDGKPVRVNVRDGTIEPMDVPEGINLSSESWSDRDQAYIESLQAEMDSLQEVAKTGILSDEQQARIQQIPQEMRTYAQDIDADSEVLSAYGDMRGDSEQSAPGSGGRGLLAQGMEGDGPSVERLVQDERGERARTQELNAVEREATEAQREADRMIEQIRYEQAGNASPGGLMSGINQARGQGGVSGETLQQAQALAERLTKVGNNENLTRDRRRWISERLLQLEELGVPINLED